MGLDGFGVWNGLDFMSGEEPLWLLSTEDEVGGLGAVRSESWEVISVTVSLYVRVPASDAPRCRGERAGIPAQGHRGARSQGVQWIGSMDVADSPAPARLLLRAFHHGAELQVPGTCWAIAVVLC